MTAMTLLAIPRRPVGPEAARHLARSLPDQGLGPVPACPGRGSPACLAETCPAAARCAALAALAGLTALAA
jgi:hypothetical protein